MKKIIFNVILIVMVATSLIAGGKNDKNLPLENLTITYVTAPLNVPSIIEKEQAMLAATFADDGTTVNYAEISSGADQTQALASGDVQILNAVGATSVILSASQGADIKVLSMYSRSPKGFCLYSNDDSLTTPESLRGKKIAGPAGTNLYELLIAYLGTAGMTLADVDYISMDIPQAKAALDGGSIDAALIAGTTAYVADKQGYSKVTDGEGLIYAIIAVAVTEEFYNNNPAVIEKFLETQETIADFIANDKDEAISIVAATLDLDVAAVEAMYPLYDFSTTISEQDKVGFQKTADFMFSADMIDAELDTSVLFIK